MSQVKVCDESAHLQELLDGALPPDRQVALTSHLDTCAACQQTLEGLASGAASWGSPGSLPKENDSPEPALQELMSELKKKASEAVTQVGPVAANVSSLEFLGPPKQPGHLGSIYHYEVTEFIGRGGMGIVLKAFDPSLHRFVAIKVLAPHLAASETARGRFQREARAAAAVSHEHVVAIYEVKEFDGLPYLAMEYVRGVSLQQRLEQSGPLKLKEILRIGMQIASGLAAAHAQGQVHRDIKPANILLENGVERVKITDFGLARAANDASLTQSGVVAGTPQYMSPEQARGDTVDHRADLFSLGTVLYTLCTGCVPFQADTVVAVLYNVCQDTPRPIQDLNPEIPDWLVQIVSRLHAKNKADRYQSAREVAELLGGHLAHLQEPSLPWQATPAKAEPQRPVKPRPGKRRRWGLAAAAVLFLAFCGIGLTDALGVTNVIDRVATTLRIRTPHGTLVVEVNDPAIDVQVEGDGEKITIRGAGIHELTLKPGAHIVSATRAGEQFDLETITVSRGDRKVLRITQEGRKAAAQPGSEGGAQRIRLFTVADKTITKDGVATDGDSLRIQSEAKRTVHLFELPNAGLEDCMVMYRARIKSNLTEGHAYLEMWCHVRGAGEFFSKGLQNPVQGTTDWASYEIPFFLKKGQRADLVKLNIVIEGKGTLWLKDIEVAKVPLNPELFAEPKAAPRSQPSAERADTKILKSLGPPDKPITQDGVSVDQGGWKIESRGARTVRLFEVKPPPGLEDCRVLYRAQIKTKDLEGKGYLEMWCRVPGAGEAFSKGFDNTFTGTSDWKTYEIPFFLEEGQRPDLLKLNVVAEGKGTVWVKDIEVLKAP
jgi:serine/threonine protein kinase